MGHGVVICDVASGGIGDWNGNVGTGKVTPAACKLLHFDKLSSACFSDVCCSGQSVDIRVMQAWVSKP